MAITNGFNPSIREYRYGLSSDTKPTGLPIGSEFYAYDSGLTYVTYDGTNWAIKKATGTGLATKTSASPLTTGNLFTYTGTVKILNIIGRVTTIIQDVSTTVKLSVKPDALDAYDICANKDIQHFAVGSLISITGTAANAAVSTTAVGSIAPGQALPVIATCVTSGLVTVTYGNASTGAIVWEIEYAPLSAGASIIAA
jgi:hypothetical protein